MAPIELSDLSERELLSEITEAFSAARLERARTTDGQTVIVKTTASEPDWLGRATDGHDRIQELWEGGVLDEVGAVVDHTVLDVQREGGRSVIVMRDASNDLLPGGTPVDESTTRDLLAGLRRLHDAFEGRELLPGCDIGARYALFAPERHDDDRQPGAHPIGDRIVRGWQLFEDHVGGTLWEVVQRIHHDPDLLGTPLGRFPATQLHGDAKLENLGLADDRLVAIDWGELTGVGPREVDVAWFALKAAARTNRSPGALFAAYEAGTALEAEAVDLVTPGSLAQMGFRMALGAFDQGPEPPEVASAHLRWWTAQARDALNRVAI